MQSGSQLPSDRTPGPCKSRACFVVHPLSHHLIMPLSEMQADGSQGLEGGLSPPIFQIELAQPSAF